MADASKKVGEATFDQEKIIKEINAKLDLILTEIKQMKTNAVISQQYQGRK